MAKDLKQRTTEHQEALKRLKSNPRVLKIRIASPPDCAAGLNLQGVYNKDDVPELPFKGCSREGGCICRYEPVLGEIYP